MRLTPSKVANLSLSSTIVRSPLPLSKPVEVTAALFGGIKNLLVMALPIPTNASSIQILPDSLYSVSSESSMVIVFDAGVVLATLTCKNALYCLTSVYVVATLALEVSASPGTNVNSVTISPTAIFSTSFNSIVVPVASTFAAIRFTPLLSHASLGK